MHNKEDWIKAVVNGEGFWMGWQLRLVLKSQYNLSWKKEDIPANIDPA